MLMSTESGIKNCLHSVLLPLQLLYFTKLGQKLVLVYAQVNIDLPCYQCCVSVTCWHGSGSADPCLWLMDPNPAADPDIFVIDLEDSNIKLLFLSFSAYYILELHIHHFSKIKSLRNSQNIRNQGFSYFFWLIRRIRIRIRTSGCHWCIKHQTN